MRGFSPCRLDAQRAQQYSLPLWINKDADFSAHAEAEDRKLRKELALEVLALKVPFRNLQVFLNQVPWPGQLGATRALKPLDAGRATRVADNMPG